MIEKIKKNKLKACIIGLSLVVFVVGIVVTFNNTDVTYSESISDYYCPSGYGDPFVNIWGTEPYYCCPSGYTHISNVDIDSCVKNIGGVGDATADSICSGSYTSYSNNWYCVSDMVVARKKKVNYTVTYDTDGGNSIASETVLSGASLVLPKPEKVGYVFKYWLYISGSNVNNYSAGATFTPTESVTLTAVWENIESCYYCTGATPNYIWSLDAPEVYCPGGTWSIVVKNMDECTGGDSDIKDPGNTGTESGGKEDDDSGTSTTPSTPSNPTTEYTITYDANGGTGAPASQTGSSLTISTTKPTKKGYTFTNWNTKADGSGTSYNSGSSYTAEADVTLYAQYKPNEYNIAYELNGGSASGNPTKATYDAIVEIKKPTKTVTVTGNANNTGATIGKATSAEQKFTGWTSTTIDTSTAYHGNTAWTDEKTKVTDTSFKNLTPVNGGTVTMVANWEPAPVTLPTVVKNGYICNWNTKADGTGTSYNSGGSYTPTSTSAASINVYAICKAVAGGDSNIPGTDDKVDDKTDDEIITNNKTGDVLIILAWVIGLGALGYSIYFFRNRKYN